MPQPTSPLPRAHSADDTGHAAAGAPTAEHRERPQWQGLFQEPNLPPVGEDDD